MNDTTTIVLIVLAVLVVLAVVGVVLAQKRKRDGLRQKFGPEYDRTVEGAGGRRDAEKELQQRTRRREELDIRPLEPQRRDAFSAEWRATQEEFVDRPSEAVRDANGLVERVMAERGYPVQDFDQMARDVSVDHATVVSEYRSAHEISQRNDRGEASTEDLRQAMVHYRSLFADLLDAGEHDRPGGGAPPADGSRDRHPEGGRR
jgi:hypothetical protein